MAGLKTDYQLADWMSQLPESCLQTPLNLLAIPGSHNTFSYSISPSGDVGPDQPQWIQDLTRLFGTAGKDILYRWATTQNLPVLQQLEQGIRYLDCRVCWFSKTQDFHFLHGLVGAKVSTCLDEVNAFLDKHPKEVIILNFSHFYSMSNTDHVNLLTMLTDKFGSKMCPYIDMESVTIEMMWEHNLQVLIIYQNDIVKEHLTFWPQTAIRAPWANTANIPDMMSFLDAKYKTGRTDNVFYNWQGVLTPGMATIVSNFGSSLKDTLSIKLAPFFVSWLKDKKTGSHGISICVVDFIEHANYVSTLIDLNHSAC
ncbi:PI-PLC X domain-containing protein 3-like isoform X1 [Mizuhopecten yessoensis]|uniref:PI-PLC X domain-containing protein 3 n=1 Tax=Mizuhopecten yessoensis TaxID=6573 RepID=A0A210R4C6_MIZYE|nr:PI-PLC X domain-containing protein 3-like isoform X1 [Mizuhopecten yessoensis]OWF55842.1 PI-PLC X domain-containing protein 3 [Mizuhopecten yessoensis]